MVLKTGAGGAAVGGAQEEQEVQQIISYNAFNKCSQCKSIHFTLLACMPQPVNLKWMSI